MSESRTGTFFLYMILAGVVIGLPVIIIISSKTVIVLDTLFNIYGVCLLLSAVQYKWIKRVTSSTLITFLYLLFGSSLILMCLFVSLNYLIPSGPERNEDHMIETVDYSSGNMIITFKDSAYTNDPGMRRFEEDEVEKAPKEMIVRYTTRRGLFGFPVLINRKIR